MDEDDDDKSQRVAMGVGIGLGCLLVCSLLLLAFILYRRHKANKNTNSDEDQLEEYEMGYAGEEFMHSRSSSFVNVTRAQPPDEGAAMTSPVDLGVTRSCATQTTLPPGFLELITPSYLALPPYNAPSYDETYLYNGPVIPPNSSQPVSRSPSMVPGAWRPAPYRGSGLPITDASFTREARLQRQRPQSLDRYSWNGIQWKYPPYNPQQMVMMAIPSAGQHHWKPRSRMADPYENDGQVLRKPYHHSSLSVIDSMDSLKQFDYNINSTTATNQEEQEVSEHLDVEVEDDIMDLKPEYPIYAVVNRKPHQGSAMSDLEEIYIQGADLFK